MLLKLSWAVSCIYEAKVRDCFILCKDKLFKQLLKTTAEQTEKIADIKSNRKQKLFQASTLKVGYPQLGTSCMETSENNKLVTLLYTYYSAQSDEMMTSRIIFRKTLLLRHFNNKVCYDVAYYMGCTVVVLVISHW